MRSKLIYTFYLFLCCLIVAVGAVFFYVSALPYLKIKSYLNSLTADGNVESYTEVRHFALFIKYRYLSFILFVSGFLLFFFRKKLTALITYHARHISIYTREKAGGMRDLFLSEERGIKFVLLLIFAGGVVLRIKQLFAPLIYDEAFTHISYVIKPLFISLSDYSYPNNHLFHTFLAHLSWRIFGEHPWALRLPAFIAGALVIPGCWLLAKKIAGSGPALFTALLISAHPSMIYYSGIARGYSLVMLLFISSLLIISDPVFIKRSGSLVWLLIFSAAGFYTIPTFIYPFLVVMCCASVVVYRNNNYSL